MVAPLQHIHIAIVFKWNIIGISHVDTEEDKMILVLAEKPSVARELARVIGAKTKGNGFLSGNGYIVTWGIGHLVTLKQPNEIDEKWKHWRQDTLPMLPQQIPLKVIPKTKAQFAVIKKLMNAETTERIICATDAGREGELIFRYIYQYAKCKKPFSRLWISSMTDEAIKTGFQNLQDGAVYNRLYESAKCRSEADWLIGMNASRAFTIRYNALLSIGRVQTPTLQLLVKRRKEIDSFVPEPYFTVICKFDDFSATWFSKLDGGVPQTHIAKKAEAQKIADQILGKNAIVRKIETKSKKEAPPLLYDLTALQRDANNRYGFSASKTLNIAQSLYEKHKAITYPRTDCRYLPNDVYESAKKAIINLPSKYDCWAKRLTEQPLTKSKRIFNNEKISDHHAIIPTGKTCDIAKLSSDEAKLYDLIIKRLLAVFYPDYEYDSAFIMMMAEKEKLFSKGIKIKQLGWKEIYSTNRNSNESTEKEQQLPRLEIGDTRLVQKATINDCMTKPPAEYTDATLLSAMESAGRSFEDDELAQKMKGCSLGTPATRAAIIERLIEVGYAYRRSKQIVATEKGVALISAVPVEMASPELTGRWELALDKIANGEGDCERFMDGIRRMSAFVVDYAFSKASDGVIEAENYQETNRKTARGKKSSQSKTLDIICPLCHTGHITENSKAFGCSRWKEGCTFTVWKNAVKNKQGPEISEKLLRLLLTSESKKLRGSNGVLIWNDGGVAFEPLLLNQVRSKKPNDKSS